MRQETTRSGEINVRRANGVTLDTPGTHRPEDAFSLLRTTGQEFTLSVSVACVAPYFHSRRVYVGTGNSFAQELAEIQKKVLPFNEEVYTRAFTVWFHLSYDCVRPHTLNVEETNFLSSGTYFCGDIPNILGDSGHPHFRLWSGLWSATQARERIQRLHYPVANTVEKRLALGGIGREERTGQKILLHILSAGNHAFTLWMQENAPEYPLVYLNTSEPELSPVPHGHASIGFDAYAQWTNPRRRLADLLNQLSLWSFLHGEDPPFTEDQLWAVCKRLNR